MSEAEEKGATDQAGKVWGVFDKTRGRGREVRIFSDNGSKMKDIERYRISEFMPRESRGIDSRSFRAL